MLFSVKLALALVWALQITTRAAPAPSQVLAISDEYAMQFGIRDQQVLVSSQIQRPMLWGLGHATIVLPEHCQFWSDTELRLVFAHEFAHISRRDHLNKIAFQCVQALLVVLHPEYGFRIFPQKNGRQKM